MRDIFTWLYPSNLMRRGVGVGGPLLPVIHMHDVTSGIMIHHYEILYFIRVILAQRGVRLKLGDLWAI